MEGQKLFRDEFNQIYIEPLFLWCEDFTWEDYMITTQLEPDKALSLESTLQVILDIKFYRIKSSLAIALDFRSVVLAFGDC